MPSKTWRHQWIVDASQPMAAYKASAAAMKGLDAQALKTVSSLEAVLGRIAKAAHGATAAVAAKGPVSATAHVAAAVAGVDRLTKATRDGAAAKSHIYTQEEARLKAHELTVKGINKRMIDDAAGAMRAQAELAGAAERAARRQGHGAASQERRKAEFSAMLLGGAPDATAAAGRAAQAAQLRASRAQQQVEQVRARIDAAGGGQEVPAGAFFKGRSSPAIDAKVKSLYGGASAAAKASGESYKDYLARHTTVERVPIASILAGQQTLEADRLRHLSDPAVLAAMHRAGNLPTVDVAGGAMTASDGHHRLAVMAARGQTHADVNVVRLPGSEQAVGAGARVTVPKAPGGGEPHVDVGYYKAAMEGIKLQDKQRAAADKLQAQLAAYAQKSNAAAAQVAGAQTKAAQSTSNAWASAYNNAAVEAQKGAAKEEAITARKAAALESQQKGPIIRLAQFKRRQATEEEVAAAAHNRHMDALNQKNVASAQKALYGTRSAFVEAIAGATGLDRATTNVGAAMLTLSVGRTTINGITEAFAKAKANADAMAEKTLATVAGLRALASVAGRKPDETFGSEVLKFGVQTGLGAQRAARFQESFLGRAQIVKGKTIADQAAPGGGPSEFDKFMVSAGKLATAKDIPDEVAADLAGGVLKVENFKAKGQGADEATSRLMGAMKILDAGSGKMAILGPQLNKAIAELTSEDKLAGVFRNVGEAAVATSVAAEHDPGEAGTMVSRTSIALRDFEDKDKKAFFKRAGITERDSFLEAIKKANVVIGEEVAKGIPVDTAIKAFGFDKEIRAERGLKTFFGARETVLKPQLENLAKTEVVGAPEAAKADLAALTREKTFKDAQAQARVEKSEFEIGKKATDLDIAKNEAKAELIERGGFNDTVMGRAGFLNQWIAGVASGFTRKGSEILVEEEALNRLKDRAGEGGVMGEVRSRVTAQFGDTAAEAKRLSDKISLDLTRAIEAQTKALEEHNRILKAQGRPGINAAPAPLPAVIAPPRPLRP